MPTAFTVDAELKLKTDGFTKNMNKASKETQEFTEDLGSASQSTTSWGENVIKQAGNIAKAVAGLSVVQGAKQMAEDFWNLSTASATTLDAIDKGSQRIGFSTQGYQEWSYVLQQNGADVETLEKGINKMNQDLANYRSSSSETRDAYKKLGLNMKELATMTPEEQFAAVVTALQQMPDGSEKAGVAMTIFGQHAVQLMPLLNSTADATEDLKEEAHAMGMVMSNESIQAGVTFGDSVSKMEGAVGALKTNIGVAAIGVFQPLVDDAATMVASINDYFFGEGGLDKKFGKIVAEYKKEATEIETTSIEASGLVTLLDRIANGEIDGEEEGGTLWMTTLDQLQEKIPGVASIVEQETGKIQGGTQAIKDYIAAWKDAAYEAAKDKALKSRQDAIIQAQADLANAQVEYQIQKARLDNYNSIIEKSGVSGAELEMAKYDPTTRNMYYGTDLYYALENYQDAEQAVLKQEQIVSENETALQNAQNEMDLVSQAIDAMNTEAGEAAEGVDELAESLEAIDGKTYTAHVVVDQDDDYRPHATGLYNVPFDGYKASLHRGEQILTAVEAQEYRAQQNGQSSQQNAVNIDYDKLGSVVADAVAGITISLDGKAITKHVSQGIAAQTKQRRYVQG